MDINQRIFYLLKTQNKTAKELGKYIQVAQSSISGWKNEGSYPSSKHLVRISEFFKVSVQYLCTGEDSDYIADNNLSIDESELMDTYRKLDRRGKAKVITVSYEELDRIEAQESTNKTDKIPKTTNVGA